MSLSVINLTIAIVIGVALVGYIHYLRVHNEKITKENRSLTLQVDELNRSLNLIKESLVTLSENNKKLESSVKEAKRKVRKKASNEKVSDSLNSAVEYVNNSLSE